MSWVDCRDIAKLIKDPKIHQMLPCWERVDEVLNLDFDAFPQFFSGADEGAFAFELTQYGSRIRFSVPYHSDFMYRYVWHSTALPI
jgi:hypothetical protein